MSGRPPAAGRRAHTAPAARSRYPLGPGRRAGAAQADGITILDDSRAPRAVHLGGDWKLSDEMLAAGTVPQVADSRKCSAKAKGWVLDQFLAVEMAGRPYRHVMGFEVARSAGPGPGRWSWTGPPERQARTGGIPDAPRSAAPGTRSASQTARNAIRSARTAVRWTTRSSSPGTLTPERASPGGQLRPDACGGRTEDVCPPRTRVRQPATGRAPGRSGAVTAPPPGVRAAAVTGGDPARSCDRGGRPSRGPATRQRGHEGPGPVPGSYLRCRPAGWRRAEL